MLWNLERLHHVDARYPLVSEEPSLHHVPVAHEAGFHDVVRLGSQVDLGLLAELSVWVVRQERGEEDALVLLDRAIEHRHLVDQHLASGWRRVHEAFLDPLAIGRGVWVAGRDDASLGV